MKKINLNKTILSTLLFFVIISGSAFAFMFRQTGYKNNQFIPATVNCEIVDVVDSANSEITSIKVKNTGNIKSYIRIKFVSYWTTTQNGYEQISSKASVMPTFSYTDDWIKGSDDTYYYSVPVSPNSFTEELLSSKIFLIKNGSDSMTIDMLGEAIQSMPADAVEISWNLQLDENGNILSVN